MTFPISSASAFRAILLSLFYTMQAVVAAPAVPTQPSKPDILLLMPDQMRGDCLSLLEHPVARTPQIDKLAHEGTLFRRAYSTCPSCIPARRSLLTGLFPASSRIVGFVARPIQDPTLPKLLGEAGYKTILVGRSMHQVPKEELYGYQNEITGSTYIPDDDYDTFLKKVAPASGGIRQLVADMGLSNNGWAAKPWPLDDTWHPSSWIAAQARKVLATTSTDRPIFLTASFYSPHPPLFPPKRFFDKYYKLGGGLPSPAHGDWVAWDTLSPDGDKAGHRVLLQGEPLRRTQAGYFGLIEHLDTLFKPLISDFKSRSRKAGRPWIIVLTSDHGEMLGDHGFYRKCEPFEGSANIPLIVAASPGLGFKKNNQSMRPVCLEDIMPTLLEVAGASCPGNLDGVSMTPLLRGENRVLREFLHFEHAPCYSKEQSFQALTDGRLKYIWRPLDGGERLFDLEKDPREEHDLSLVDSRRDLLGKWRERMIHQLANRPEGFTDGASLISGRPYKAVQQ